MSFNLSARIVLAVTGSIAAYKAADLTSRLVQSGATVEVVLTAGGSAFIQPTTFNALTRRPVHTELFAPWTDESAGHVTLAQDADLLLVAPASANAIARLALGLSDDLLGAVALATRAPLMMAPAMEDGMFHHPATQAHLATLQQRGAIVIGPESGRLASGAVGDGRMAAVETILGAVRVLLGRGGPLAGRRVVVTAAGTHEPLDPVRFIGNRSSGMMGYALAGAALDRGATVALISGPTSLAPPYGVEMTRVETAEQMFAEVRRAADDAEVLIMAAAVADFRPAAKAPSKIKKGPGQDRLSLELVRNPDILASINRPGLIKIGFAAETENLVEHAATKLRTKGLAMIVANDAVATIGRRESAAIVLRAGAPPEELPTMPKEELAAILIDRVIALVQDQHAEVSAEQ